MIGNLHWSVVHRLHCRKIPRNMSDFKQAAITVFPKCQHFNQILVNTNFYNIT